MNILTNEALEKLCGPKTNEALCAPFSAQINKQWWNFATDGHALAGERSEVGDYVRGAGVYTPDVGRILKPADAQVTHTADLAALCRWLSDSGKLWKPCEQCRGLGVHECNCCRCPILAGSLCRGCSGAKGEWNRLRVHFGELHFDRVLASRYLAPFAGVGGDAVVIMGGPLEPIEFRGPDWRVVIMPMKRSPEHDDEAVLLPDGLIVEVRS